MRYPENQQQQIRVQVASTLRAVIVQTLIPRASGHGRAPATEVMINNPAVAALIRSGKAHQIRTVLQSGEKEGMHTLDPSHSVKCAASLFVKPSIRSSILNSSVPS